MYDAKVKREKFSSGLAVFFATLGSAVGLGNIWFVWLPVFQHLVAPGRPADRHICWILYEKGWPAPRAFQSWRLKNKLGHQRILFYYSICNPGLADYRILKFDRSNQIGTLPQPPESRPGDFLYGQMSSLQNRLASLDNSCYMPNVSPRSKIVGLAAIHITPRNQTMLTLSYIGAGYLVNESAPFLAF